MDPLSITLSVITIVQGLEQLSHLLSLFKPFFLARKDITAILEHVNIINKGFEEVLAVLSTLDDSETVMLHHSLSSFQTRLNKLKCHLAHIHDTKLEDNKITFSQRKAWVQRKADIKRLKMELLELIPWINMQLHLTSMYKNHFNYGL
jgi:hypothetical protein